MAEANYVADLKGALDAIMLQEFSSTGKFIERIKDEKVGNEYAEKALAKENSTMYLVIGGANVNHAPDEERARVIANMTDASTRSVIELLTGAAYVEKAVKSEDVGAIDDIGGTSKYVQEINELKGKIQELDAAYGEAQEKIKDFEGTSFEVTKDDVIKYLIESDPTSVGEIQKGVMGKYVLTTPEGMLKYGQDILSGLPTVEQFNDTLSQIEYLNAEIQKMNQLGDATEEINVAETPVLITEAPQTREDVPAVIKEGNSTYSFAKSGNVSESNKVRRDTFRSE